MTQTASSKESLILFLQQDTLTLFGYPDSLRLPWLSSATLTLFGYPDSSSATLTQVFPCFFLSCKANARVKLAKMGHGPHSSQLVVICVVLLLFVFSMLFVLFYALFVCNCVLYYCHRVSTQLQLINISYTNLSHRQNHRTTCLTAPLETLFLQNRLWSSFISSYEGGLISFAST